MIGRVLHHAETLAAVAIGLAAFLVAWPAYPQSNCAERAGMVPVLEDKYGETQRSVGLVNPVTVVELFFSSGGSFTLLLTNVQGQSCIMISGTQWQDVPPPQRLPGGDQNRR